VTYEEEHESCGALVSIASILVDRQRKCRCQGGARHALDYVLTTNPSLDPRESTLNG
jgi:hypothetical protein